MSLLFLTVSSQTTNGIFMLHLPSPKASETVRTGRNIDLSAVLSETRAILDRCFKIFFCKSNNNKKDYYVELNLFFPMLTGLFQVCAKQKCSSVSHCFTLIINYFDKTHVKTHAILSFFLNWMCSNVVVLCLQWTSTVIYMYLYLVWVINWQPVWLEYC